MQLRKIHILVTLPVILSLGWAAVALSAEPVETETSGEEQQETVEEQIDQEKQRIDARVGMASSLEVDASADPCLIEEKIEHGMLIETTLEEVEAAVQAAALTPEKEDDIEAEVLKHRGSYRFFLPE